MSSDPVGQCIPANRRLLTREVGIDQPDAKPSPNTPHLSQLHDLFEVAATRNLLVLYKIAYVTPETVDGCFVASA